MRRLVPIAVLAATAAAAHPLGRDEHSLRLGLEVGKDGVHAVIVGEVPLAVAIAELGRRAGGNRPTPEQVTTYTAERQRELADGAALTVDGRAVDLAWTPAASAINGRAVDGFFVYVVEARVPADQLDADVTLNLKTAAWPDVSMVYASQVRALTGWTVASSDAPADWTAEPAARSLTARFTQP
jgi:hypothetical protein